MPMSILKKLLDGVFYRQKLRPVPQIKVVETVCRLKGSGTTQSLTNLTQKVGDTMLGFITRVSEFLDDNQRLFAAAVGGVSHIYMRQK